MYYKTDEKFLPRFLCEWFGHERWENPTSAQEVLDWANEHYKQNKFCQGFFEFLRSGIEDYIKESRTEAQTC